MEIATLCLLMRDGKGGKEILLAMKKVRFGKGKWNGPGGRVENETIEEATKREVLEEVGVTVCQLEKVAVLTFFFENNPEWDQEVHVFLSTSFEGESKETEEMAPKWFPVEEIPYDSMWVDDKFWLPAVLAGEKVQATFVFSDSETITDQKIEKVPDGQMLR